MLRLVPTPLGNLEDITLRALEALRSADVILCEDTRVTKQLLFLLSQRHHIDFGHKTFHAVHEHNQKAFLQKISPEFFAQEVVYVSDAGMPGISDPGAMLVRYAQEHDIAYEVLPGPSAAITAFVASGFGCVRFAFYGFLPHKGAERFELLQKLLKEDKCVVLYESPHRLLKLLEELAAMVPERTVFLAKELTKRYEQFFKDSAANLYEQFRHTPIKGEWVVVIDKGEENLSTLTLSIEDILQLPLPKKELAKMLAKVSDKSAKEWYAILTKD